MAFRRNLIMNTYLFPISSTVTLPLSARIFFCTASGSEVENKKGKQHDNKTKQSQEQIIDDFIVRNLQSSPLDISILKKEVLSKGSTVNHKNFDAIFMEICNSHSAFDMGRDYFYSLHNKGHANLATVGKFCKLCYTHRELCGTEEKSVIKKLYKSVLHQHPLLDTRTCENLAFGLAITDSWRVGLHLLKLSSATCDPSISTYLAVISGALNNNEIDLAWELLEKCSKEGERNANSVFKLWVNLTKTIGDLERLFFHLEKFGIQVEEDLVTLIALRYKEFEPSLNQTHFTNISPRVFGWGCVVFLWKSFLLNKFL